MNANDNKSNDDVSNVSGKMHVSPERSRGSDVNSAYFLSNSAGISNCTDVSLQENRDSIGILVSLELTEDEDTAPRPPISFCALVIPEEDDDKDQTTNNVVSWFQNTGGAALKSSEGGSVLGNRPEYVANDGPSLPPTVTKYESAGDAKAMIEMKNASSDAFPITIMDTQNIQSLSHDNAQDLSSQVEHDTDGQPTSSPGVTQALFSDDVARRTKMYDGPQLASDGMQSNNERHNQTQRGISFSRPFTMVPTHPVHHSVEMGGIPIPNTRSRKVRNVVVVLGVVFIALGIVIAIVASSHKKSDSPSNTASTTSSQEDFPVSLPSDDEYSDVVSLSNYKHHVCNPTDAYETETEFCMAANCFSGPHCSCDMYFRDTISKSTKGLCDSCQVCDLKSNFAFDCSNLGLSVQECPKSSASRVKEEPSMISMPGANWGQYSPPVSYIDRFCIPSTDSLTELCYAGECTDDEKCRCDLYTREISTGNIVGVCDACGVCADGGFSSDCVNVGLAAVACRKGGDTSSMTNDQTIDYNNDESPLTNDQKIQDISNIAPPHLTIGRGEPSKSYSEDDYSCTDPSNGVEICYARSCNVSVILMCLCDICDESSTHHSKQFSQCNCRNQDAHAMLTFETRHQWSLLARVRLV